MKKTILKYLLVFITLIISYVLLLTIMSSFTTTSIKTNIKSSAFLLAKEGNWPERNIFYRGYGIQFDNYMDAVALSTIWSTDTSHPFKSAMLMAHDGFNAKQETVGELESEDAVGDLIKTVNGQNIGTEYARYWHGYILWLKPLLLFMDLKVIRITLTITLCILFALLLGSLIKDKYITEAIILGIGLLFSEYFYMGTSLQGVSVFLIMMIISLFIWYQKQTLSGILFFISGSLVAFTDLLTVPMLGLIIPLVVYQIKYNDTIKVSLKHSFVWILGFSLTWGSKWILTDIFFNRNILKTAFEQILWRSNGSGNVSYITTIFVCFLFMKTFLLPTLLLFVVLLLVFHKRITKQRFKNSIIYLVIAATPFIWYGILKTHSCYHAYFTYRNAIALFIGLFLFLHTLCRKEKNNANT